MEAELTPRRDNGQIVFKMMVDEVANAVKYTVLGTNLKRRESMEKVYNHQRLQHWPKTPYVLKEILFPEQLVQYLGIQSRNMGKQNCRYLYLCYLM